MQSPCELCSLRCGLIEAQEALPKIILDAKEQMALSHLGVDITLQAVDETMSDARIEQEMGELTDVRDDFITAGAKASERYDLLQAAVDAIQDSVAQTARHLEVKSRGPIDLRTAGELEQLMGLSCESGPKRGLRVPLTGMVVPLPGGRGKEYCGSASSGTVRRFLGRLSARYAGLLNQPKTAGSPDA